MSYTSIASNLTNISSLEDVLKFANTSTQDSFWTGIFYMLIAIMFIVTLSFGFEVAMIMTFFGGLILGMFLLYMGLINWVIFAGTEAVLIFIVLYLVYTSSKNQ